MIAPIRVFSDLNGRSRMPFETDAALPAPVKPAFRAGSSIVGSLCKGHLFLRPASPGRSRLI